MVCWYVAWLVGKSRWLIGICLLGLLDVGFCSLGLVGTYGLSVGLAVGVMSCVDLAVLFEDFGAAGLSSVDWLSNTE